MRDLANSNKTFFTIIFSTCEGKNCVKFFFVMQKDALVLIANDLYFNESKNVRSALPAKLRVFTSLIVRSFLKFILGNNLLILTDFLEKKLITYYASSGVYIFGSVKNLKKIYKKYNFKKSKTE